MRYNGNNMSKATATTPRRTPPRISAADILRSGLPVYRGSLIKYSRRCGAAGCLCSRGQPHTGWALSVSIQGRTQAVYIPDTLRRAVAAGLRRHRNLLALLERIASADTGALRQRARRYKKRR
jgi:hypothetical protein